MPETLNDRLTAILEKAIVTAMETAKPALDAALENERKEKIVTGLCRPEMSYGGNINALEMISSNEVDRRAEVIARAVYGPAPLVKPALSWTESKEAYRAGATGHDRIEKWREFEAKYGTQKQWDKPPFAFRKRQASDVSPALGTATIDPSQVGYAVVDAGGSIGKLFGLTMTKPNMGRMTRSWSSSGRVKTLVFLNLAPDDLRAVLIESENSPLNQGFHDAEVKRSQDAIGLRDRGEFEAAFAPATK